MRTGAVAVVALALAGCATGHFYTWKCPDDACRSLQTDSESCTAATSRSYSPVIAGHGPLVTIYKDCMESRGYVKVGDSLPATSTPGVGGSGISVGDRSSGSMMFSSSPKPIDSRLVDKRLVGYLPPNTPDTTKPEHLQPINAICIPEATNTHQVFAFTQEGTREFHLRALVKCQMGHGIVYADRGSSRVLGEDEVVDYMLLRRGPDPASRKEDGR